MVHTAVSSDFTNDFECCTKSLRILQQLMGYHESTAYEHLLDQPHKWCQRFAQACIDQKIVTKDEVSQYMED